MTKMTKTLKTAPELERYVLNELRNCSACNSISAVTVTETARAGLQLGGLAHQCRGRCRARGLSQICEDTVARLRERYDLVIEIEPEEI